MNKMDLSNISTYRAGALQASMHRLLQKKSDEILAPFGISKMHWMIIGHVLDAGKAGTRISDLAKDLGTTISYVTTAVNILEPKGFLMRKDNDDDARSKIITINTSQVKKCHEIEVVLREGLRKAIYAKVKPEDFRTYMKVMMELKNLSEGK